MDLQEYNERYGEDLHGYSSWVNPNMCHHRYTESFTQCCGVEPIDEACPACGSAETYGMII